MRGILSRTYAHTHIVEQLQKQKRTTLAGLARKREKKILVHEVFVHRRSYFIILCAHSTLHNYTYTVCKCVRIYDKARVHVNKVHATITIKNKRERAIDRNDTLREKKRKLIYIYCNVARARPMSCLFSLSLFLFVYIAVQRHDVQLSLAYSEQF